MSYTLFLLLNVNHRPEDLFPYLAEKLEQTGPSSFCLDQSPDLFYSVDYLKEGNDTSLAIDAPFGSEETIIRELLEFMTYVDARIQFQVFDPQLARVVKQEEAPEIIAEWKKLNLAALDSYSDGHYFLRSVEERDGRKVMIEAVKYKEETWPNHCSVGLACGRVGESDKALRHFERALELDPGNSGILYALGVTYFNLKDFEKAKQVLMQAIEADAANEAAAALLEDCRGKLQLR